MACSSLLAARRSSDLQKRLPALDCIKVLDETCSQDSSPMSTSASSATSSPVSSQRISGFRRLSIDIDLVRQESLLLTSSFKNSQCQRLSEQFEGLVKIGEGSCAIVYRGVRRRDQQEAALKIMRMDDEELVKNAEKEYSLLQLVNHPNIIKALDFFTYSGGAVLVEEFFDGDSLEIMFGDEMEGRRSENFACFLFIQLLDAVAYLHKQGVIHRDVKAQNVLVSRNMTDLRLIDFNCSKLLAEGMALTMTGTREYMPPEVLKGSSPSEASDVWACGLCFHYMLTGGLPARRNGLHVHFNSSFEVVSMPCKEVVQKCLMPRRELRPQADEILSFARLVLV